MLSIALIQLKAGPQSLETPFLVNIIAANILELLIYTAYEYITTTDLRRSTIRRGIYIYFDSNCVFKLGIF